MKQRNLLLKIHFGLLLLVFLNYVLRQFTDFSISSFIIFPLKIITYLTGLKLFLMTIKPFQKKAMYFALYVLSPLGVILSWLFDGLFGAIVGSIFFWTIAVDDSIKTSDNYIISKPFSGFLAPCCRYNVKRNYFYILERKLGEFQAEEVDWTSAKFVVSEDERTLNLKYHFIYWDQSVDTTLTLY
jgi:hypothetical protein